MRMDLESIDCRHRHRRKFNHVRWEHCSALCVRIHIYSAQIEFWAHIIPFHTWPINVNERTGEQTTCLHSGKLSKQKIDANLEVNSTVIPLISIASVCFNLITRERTRAHVVVCVCVRCAFASRCYLIYLSRQKALANISGVVHCKMIIIIIHNKRIGIPYRWMSLAICRCVISVKNFRFDGSCSILRVKCAHHCTTKNGIRKKRKKGGKEDRERE